MVRPDLKLTFRVATDCSAACAVRVSARGDVHTGVARGSRHHAAVANASAVMGQGDRHDDTDTTMKMTSSLYSLMGTPWRPAGS
ncbi:MAG: hypothetical protein ACLT98_12280 [Eggerthellaceae bacterium]